jgi:hypothetical protein
MPLINERANAQLDYVLGTPGFLPSTVYIGLLLVAPNSDGTGVSEPVGGSYTRVAVANNSTQWPAAVSRVKTHANDITFPTATGNWGTLNHFGIFSGATGANLKIYNALDVPRVINSTDVFRFLAGTNPLKLIA